MKLNEWATVTTSSVRIVQWSVYALLVAVFLLAYVALYLPPKVVWWLQLIAPLVPVVSGLIVVATWWLFRTARLSLRLVHLMLLFLVIVRFGSAIVPRMGANRGDATGLVVMSYNSKQHQPSAQATVDTLFREVRPDVVSMQEASMSFIGDDFGASSNVIPVWELGSYDIGHPPTDARRFIQLPVFSTLDWIDFRELKLTDPVVGELGRLAQAHLLWNDREIIVLNVHLRSYLKEQGLSWADLHPNRWSDLLSSLREDVLKRARQAEMVREHIDAVDQPLLVTGDFNATRHNWEYRHLSGGLQDVIGRSDAWWNATFPSRAPVVRIDFIFASRAWNVTTATTGPSLTSDHRPVTATVTLRRGF